MHLKLVLLNKSFKNSCLVFNIFSFSNASSLIIHTASVHGTKRRWKCDVVDCLKEFKRKETLIAHKNTVHLVSSHTTLSK